jgi:hypothetical protein
MHGQRQYDGEIVLGRGDKGTDGTTPNEIFPVDEKSQINLLAGRKCVLAFPGSEQFLGVLPSVPPTSADPLARIGSANLAASQPRQR